MSRTRHAEIRTQQRGIPPIVDRLLDEFGEETYDHHGGVKVYFSKGSIREMKRKLGREPVQKLSEFFRYYRIDSSHDGCIITTAHKYRRIWRN